MQTWRSLVVVLLASTPGVLQAQSFYSVSKSQLFRQTSAAAPVADPNGGFLFQANAASAVNLAIPGGSTTPLPFRSGDRNTPYRLEQTFATKAALDAAFPNGIYRMSGASIPTVSLNLAADNYPATIPQVTAVTNGTWNSAGMLVVDPSLPVTLNFNTFAGYGTGGLVSHMNFVLSGMFDNVDIENDIISQAGWMTGLPVQATPFTSSTIPARTLTSGRVYQASVDFDNFLGGDLTSIPGSLVAEGFTNELLVYIVAQSPGTSTPPPVFAPAPASTTAPIGGTARFVSGVTVGGSTNISNISFDWRFNGQRLDLSNTSVGKYAGSNGTTLVVNNVTTADVGTYVLTVINAGGIITSAPLTLSIGTTQAPTFNQQPAAQTTVATGSTLVLSAAVSGVPTPTLQWRKNGAAIQGATSATLVVPAATASTAGLYTLFANNSAGSNTSATANVNVVTTADPGRLINLSIFTSLDRGESMTMGTVLGGANTSGTKALLARAAGPTLGAFPFSISGTLPDPTMALISTSVSPNVTVEKNNDWLGTSTLSDAFARVGAFAYISGTSKDAAIYQPTLLPGNYTVQVSDAGTGSGQVIAELYDETPASSFTATTPRLINVSVLKQINTGASLTAGFYIGGSTAKTVLIRVIGPRLALPPFGISAAMPDPQVTLFNSSQTAIASNDNWGGDPQISAAGDSVGAFAVADAGSKDAMLLMTLAPGLYTATATPAGSSGGGLAIVEVYEVP